MNGVIEELKHINRRRKMKKTTDTLDYESYEFCHGCGNPMTPERNPQGKRYLYCIDCDEKEDRKLTGENK